MSAVTFRYLDRHIVPYPLQSVWNYFHAVLKKFLNLLILSGNFAVAFRTNKRPVSAAFVNSKTEVSVNIRIEKACFFQAA